jgi:cleavage and polyadenylation specificity factor subunit 3
MGRLKSALTSKYAEREIPLAIHTPRNTETVQLHFRGEKTAKVIGALAQDAPKEGTLIQGILASKHFSFSIIAPQDLDEFTDLVTTSILQRQTVRTHAPLGIIKWHLEQMYGPLQQENKGYKIFNAVTLYTPEDSPPRVVLEWDSNPVNDMIADSIVTVVLQAESSPASVKVTKSDCTHSHGEGHTHAHEHEEGHEGHDSSQEDSTELSDKVGELEKLPPKVINLSASKQMSRPSVSKMISKHLGLSFGSENVTVADNVWTITVDEDTATLTLDGSDWVFRANIDGGK